MDLKNSLQKNSPLLMGIVNLTLDSFSDGGLHLERNLETHILSLIENGADIVDIGAESSRPNAILIDEREELSRLDKCFELIREKKLFKKAVFSIDTRRALIAKNALLSGFTIINDVSALDEEYHGNSDTQNSLTLAKVLADNPQSYLVMNHHRGIPPKKNCEAGLNEQALLAELESFFEARINLALNQGVKKEQVILDVGLGFGKNCSENVCLLKNLSYFKNRFSLPVMIGPSRKRFVQELFEATVAELEQLDKASAAVSLLGASNGANIIRCHSPKEHLSSKISF